MLLLMFLRCRGDGHAVVDRVVVTGAAVTMALFLFWRVHFTFSKTPTTLLTCDTAARCWGQGLSPFRVGTVHPYTGDGMIVTELQGISPIALIEKMVFQNPRKTSRRRILIDNVREVLLETIHKMASDNSPDLMVPANGAPWLGATTRREAATAAASANAALLDREDDGDADESYDAETGAGTGGPGNRISPARRGLLRGTRLAGLATPATLQRGRDGDTPSRTVAKRRKLVRSSHAGQASIKKVYEHEARGEDDDGDQEEDDDDVEHDDEDDGDEDDAGDDHAGDDDGGGDGGSEDADASADDDDFDDEAEDEIPQDDIVRSYGAGRSSDLPPTTPVATHPRLPVPSALRRPSPASSDVSPAGGARQQSIARTQSQSRSSPRPRQGLGVRFDVGNAPTASSKAPPAAGVGSVSALVPLGRDDRHSSSKPSSSPSPVGSGDGDRRVCALPRGGASADAAPKSVSPTAAASASASASAPAKRPLTSTVVDTAGGGGHGLTLTNRSSCNTCVVTLVLVRGAGQSSDAGGGVLCGAGGSDADVALWFGVAEDSVGQGVPAVLASALPGGSGVAVLALPPALPLELAVARVAQVRASRFNRCVRKSRPPSCDDEMVTPLVISFVRLCPLYMSCFFPARLLPRVGARTLPICPQSCRCCVRYVCALILLFSRPGCVVVSGGAIWFCRRHPRTSPMIVFSHFLVAGVEVCSRCRR